MAIVTVYNFEVSDIQQGTFVLARGKCTREKIEEMGPKARIIEGTGEEVDEALLTHSKRYHKPEDGQSHDATTGLK